MENQLLGNDEAAAFLGMSPDTLPRWRWAGTGPAFIRLGRTIKYRTSDLQSFVEKSRVDPEGGHAGG